MSNATGPSCRLARQLGVAAARAAAGASRDTCVRFSASTLRHRHLPAAVHRRTATDAASAAAASCVRRVGAAQARRIDGRSPTWRATGRQQAHRSGRALNPTVCPAEWGPLVGLITSAPGGGRYRSDCRLSVFISIFVQHFL